MCMLTGFSDSKISREFYPLKPKLLDIIKYTTWPIYLKLLYRISWTIEVSKDIVNRRAYLQKTDSSIFLGIAPLLNIDFGHQVKIIFVMNKEDNKFHHKMLKIHIWMTCNF